MIIAKGTSIPSKYNCTVKHFAPVPFPGMKATGAFVVTGANKGIGFETVRELGKRLNLKEAAIVLCSRTLAAGDVRFAHRFSRSADAGGIHLNS